MRFQTLWCFWSIVLLGLVAPSGQPACAAILINEFLAANQGGLRDEDGETSDWIELYNSGPTPVSLAGYGLTDDQDSPLKWTFPTVNLNAGAFLLVWASDKNRTSPELHTNFKLSSTGEYLGLFTPTGALVDGLLFGPQETNVSYGRRPDGGSEWVQFSQPTPGGANANIALSPRPVFSLDSGYYPTTPSLILSVSAEGATIRYTENGAIPTTSSTRYTGPIAITSTRVIRARVFVPGDAPSPVESRTFLIGSAGSLPTLSLITDPPNLWDPSTGIYANPQQRGEAWERPVTAEFFEGGTVRFRIDGGIRIHGLASRSHPKKSFRLYFRDSYGSPYLEYPILPAKPIEAYKRLVLRAGANDQVTIPDSAFSAVWTLCRDRVMNRLAREVEPLAITQRPAKVYLNGQSWGIYDIAERIDEDYLFANTGLDEFDLMKNQQEVDYGDNTHWNFTRSFFENNNFADANVYQQATELMDPLQTATHYIIEMWGGNLDWPQNNTYQVRSREGDTRWRWILWDTDLVFGSPNWVPWDVNMYNHVNGGHIAGANWSTLHFRKFKDAPAFRTLFVNRLADLLSTTLATSRVRSAVDTAAAELRPDITFETSRWGSSSGTWENNISQMKSWASARNGYVYDHTRSFFGLSGTYNLTILQPEGQGQVRVNTLYLTSYPYTGLYFDNVPLPLVALAAPGYEFVRWEGASLSASAEASLVTTSDRSIRAVFAPKSPQVRPNDVIVSELWNNDNGTSYTSLGGRSLEGDWIELLVMAAGGVDLRGWRLTNNNSKRALDPLDSDDGSLLFPARAELSAVPQGTTILIVADRTASNTANFPSDDLDATDGNLLFYVGNGLLDNRTDPGFSIEQEDDAVVLLAPGGTSDFADDIGVDFVAEGTKTTPASFGAAADGVMWINPFAGIGEDDGAIFRATDGGNNDDGADPVADDLPGPGGWIVDPPARYTGDAPGAENILTPGGPNTRRDPAMLTVW